MIKKQVIKVEEPFNDQIVHFTHTGTNYIDGRFWRLNLAENPESPSFSVNVAALNIEWILNDASGQYFLIMILKSGNLDFFKI